MLENHHNLQKIHHIVLSPPSENEVFFLIEESEKNTTEDLKTMIQPPFVTHPFRYNVFRRCTRQKIHARRDARARELI